MVYHSWCHGVDARHQANREPLVVHGDGSQTRMKRFAALAILLAAATGTVLAQTDLTGKWLATFTRTAPDGRTQSITFDFHFTQKGKVLTGTVGPTAERQWPIEKGVVDGDKVTFQTQQPDGPLRSYKLALVKGRLVGTQDLEFQGQKAETTVDAERVK
jgi:hypothetical protein